MTKIVFSDLALEQIDEEYKRRFYHAPYIQNDIETYLTGHMDELRRTLAGLTRNAVNSSIVVEVELSGEDCEFDHDVLMWWVTPWTKKVKIEVLIPRFCGNIMLVACLKSQFLLRGGKSYYDDRTGTFEAWELAQEAAFEKTQALASERAL